MAPRVMPKSRRKPQQPKNPHASHPLWPTFVEWVKDGRSGLNKELLNDDVFLRHGLGLWRTFVHACHLAQATGCTMDLGAKIP